MRQRRLVIPWPLAFWNHAPRCLQAAYEARPWHYYCMRLFVRANGATGVFEHSRAQRATARERHSSALYDLSMDEDGFPRNPIAKHGFNSLTMALTRVQESRDGTWWAAPLQGRAELYRGLTASFHVEASEADLAEVALHEDAMLRRCEDPRGQQRRLALLSLQCSRQTVRSCTF